MATHADFPILPLEDKLEEPDVRRIDSDLESTEDPAQIKLTDDINALRSQDLPENLKAIIDIDKVKETYRHADSIGILLTGKTGAGKSTLINGILGLNVKNKDTGAAKEGRSIKEACTTEVTAYTSKKGKITVTVWDSPGLQDGTDNQEEYLRQMKKKCAERDLTIYCVGMNERRFVHGKDNPDVRAMKKLTENFGVDFWKNTAIVLTYANTLVAFNVEWEDLSKEDKASAFQAVILEWADQIKEILIKDIKVPQEIVEKVQIVPAGHYRKAHLPNRKYWLSALWFHCLEAISTGEKKVTLVALNASRFKRAEKVKEKDFAQQPNKQPIVIDEGVFKAKVYASSVASGIVGGAAIGAGLGAIGFAGGPVGLVTLPVFLVIGAVSGGIVAAGTTAAMFK